LIRENLRRLHLAGQTEVWIMPVFRALRALARRGETFDLIFLDPPYEHRWVGATLEIVAQGRLLHSSGVLIAEHSLRENVEPRYHSLALDDQRRYGSTLLSFFRQEAS
jgi:16S rRNA G966 N2-methylase RsmD